MLRVRDSQLAILRKKAICEGLTKMFSDLGYNFSIDPATGRVSAGSRVGLSQVAFDSNGFVSGVVSATGREWKLDVDRRGRVTRIVTPAGAVGEIQYNRAGLPRRVGRDGRELMSFEYSPNGMVERVVYPDRSVTELRYQASGQVIEKIDRLGYSEKYQYDSRGKLLGIVNANGNSSVIEYRSGGKLSKIAFANRSELRYQYDETGCSGRILTAHEKIAEFECESSSDRISRISYTDGEVVSFAYDKRGNTIRASNSQSAVTYEYDRSGRLVRENADGHVISYGYGESGAVACITYPSGASIYFDFDADTLLSRLTDWNGGKHEFSYGGDNRCVVWRAPNGVTATSRLRATDDIEELVVNRSGGDELFSLHYTYDNEDRIVSAKDSSFGTQEYTYDKESRVTRVSRTDAGGTMSEAFAYDPSCNRIDCNGQLAEFDDADRLIRQGRLACLYDSRENVDFLEDDQRWSFTFDARGYLARAETVSGSVVHFGYDAYGRRVWKRTYDVYGILIAESRYVWAGEQMIVEMVSKGGRTESREYAYHPWTHAPLASRADGSVYMYYGDHLGAPRRIVDSSGQVVWAGDYSAFGDVRVTVDDFTNPLRYPGHYYDTETGLHYNRFRYYSPKLGRYVSRDPLAFWGGVNLYAYCNGDPINRSDPDGLFWGAGAALLSDVIKPLAFKAAGALLTVVMAPVAAAIAPVALAGGLVAALVSGLHQVLTGQKLNLTCIGKTALSVMGKIWTLPNTLIGTLIGLAGVPFGAQIEFGNNAIQFLNFPIGDGALTLGNAVIYSKPSTPLSTTSRYDGGPGDVPMGAHEMAHTHQAELLGPFYLPFYFLMGGIPEKPCTNCNPLEVAADDNAQGKGGWWPATPP